MSSPLAEAAAAIDYPDNGAAHRTRLRQHELLLPPGSLGELDELAVWAAGVQASVPPGEFEAAAVVVVGAEHGIAAAGVSATTAADSGRLLDRLGAGSAPVHGIAAGLPVQLLDTRDWAIATPSGRIDVADALSADDVAVAIAHGMRCADELAAAGVELILADTAGAGASTPAAALISVITDTEPVRVVGRGSGIDDAAWIRKVAAVRDARRRAMPHRGNVTALLGTAGGADSAALTGLIVAAARRRVPVLLGGLPACAAALVAQLVAPRVVRWLLAGQDSDDPGHRLALHRLAVPVVQHSRVQVEQGIGPVLALPTLRDATRLYRGPVADPAG